MTSRALTVKQQRFVEEYVVDFNATAAAIRAGYSRRSAKSQGSENLTKHDIQEAVARRARELTAATGVEAERVVRELARLAFSDIRSVAKWDENGLSFLDSEELSEDAAAIIKSLKMTEVVTRKGPKSKEELVTRRLELTLHGKEGPLEDLAKYTGVLPVAGGVLDAGGDHREIHLHIDGGPDAARRSREAPALV